MTFTSTIPNLFIISLMTCLLLSCKDEVILPGSISLDNDLLDFSTVEINQPSPDREFHLLGNANTEDVELSITGDFEMIVADGTNDYSKKVILAPEITDQGVRIRVRAHPKSLGEIKGTLVITGHLETSHTVQLLAYAVPKLDLVNTFANERIAFGNGFSRKVMKEFTFPPFSKKTETINMYIKLKCPDGGCDPWDRTANVSIRPPETEEWFEMGRYITPYGVGNQQRSKGFEIDVTDFKSLLVDQVSLQLFIDTWVPSGWLVSVDFELIGGEPEFSYSAVAPIFTYQSIPYGEDHNKDLDRCISLPENSDEIAFRTIITGWGHATPADVGGRRCAEWCFRTHQLSLDNGLSFLHVMDGIGCNQNPVQPQNGNWKPDRAGWCPGMEVPTRIDVVGRSISETSFCLEYLFQDWTNDFMTSADSKNAYYNLSSFIIVKSNTPIQSPEIN